jgi:hypothetical protein
MKHSRASAYNSTFVILEGVRVFMIGATLLAITSYLPKPSEASPKTAVNRPDLFAPIEGIPASISAIPDSLHQMLKGVDKKNTLQKMDIDLLEQEGILRTT